MTAPAVPAVTTAGITGGPMVMPVFCGLAATPVASPGTAKQTPAARARPPGRAALTTCAAAPARVYVRA